jgi:hypothetical protein
MDRNDRLRRRALEALATRPDLFGRLLSVHLGMRRPVQASLDILRLGGHLLAPALTRLLETRRRRHCKLS